MRKSAQTARVNGVFETNLDKNLHNEIYLMFYMKKDPLKSEKKILKYTLQALHKLCILSLSKYFFQPLFTHFFLEKKRKKLKMAEKSILTSFRLRSHTGGVQNTKQLT